MLKVTAVSAIQIKGEYIGPEEFRSTSDLLAATINRPQIDFYLESRSTPGVLTTERYLRPVKRGRIHCPTMDSAEPK